MPTKPQRHTPGPWQVCKAAEPFKFNIESNGMNDNDNLAIAKLKGPDARANARLIAAAPALLEALQSLLAASNWYGGENPKHDTLTAAKQQARAAIAAATGEGN